MRQFRHFTEQSTIIGADLHQGWHACLEFPEAWWWWLSTNLYIRRTLARSQWPGRFCSRGTCQHLPPPSHCQASSPEIPLPLRQKFFHEPRREPVKYIVVHCHRVGRYTGMCQHMSQYGHRVLLTSCPTVRDAAFVVSLPTDGAAVYGEGHHISVGPTNPRLPLPV